MSVFFAYRIRKMPFRPTWASFGAAPTAGITIVRPAADEARALTISQL